ncbi:nuclear transport factor 2 family protein [Paraburkholderia sp. J41]|uniref:nuclear transport factor 2 family protein n=1 Tax=Paraburkholderia sp. J41 TaxID=2805433 RepID=UPI002AC32732|nr:nuclear transport factor 2 family protein [Paraburkholderia sp. J41]
MSVLSMGMAHARAGNETLEARVGRLEAIEAIRALKAHYGALADAKYDGYRKRDGAALAEIARRQAACFTADAVWAGGNGFGGDLVGREAIERWFLASPWRFAMHYYVSETLCVDVQGGEARANWRLMQIALREGADADADADPGAVWLGAVTTEHYRRDETSGLWLIRYMKFEALHMMTLADGPLPIAGNFADLDATRVARTEDTQS